MGSEKQSQDPAVRIPVKVIMYNALGMTILVQYALLPWRDSWNNNLCGATPRAGRACTKSAFGIGRDIKNGVPRKREKIPTRLRAAFIAVLSRTGGADI